MGIRVCKKLIGLSLVALFFWSLSSCASKSSVKNKQATKTKKKTKEKPRPRPLPKIYRPKMMADDPEEKSRKPSNDRVDETSRCGSNKLCQ